VQKIVLMILFSFTVVACVTPYQSGLLGWNYATKVSENIYDINVTVNGFTSSSVAREYASLKSAETALEEGNTHYRLIKGVIESGGSTPGYRINAKIEIGSPKDLEDSENRDWEDAQEIYDRLAPKYIK